MRVTVPERLTLRFHRSWRPTAQRSTSRNLARMITRGKTRLGAFRAWLWKISTSFGRRLDAHAIFQLGCAFSVLYGISYWSVPCSLIVGGVAGIAVVEIRRKGG